MKRILAITLTLIMVLAALSGCMASQNPSGNEGEQNPSGNTGGVPLPAISVRSLAELEEMREMVSCTDEEKLNEYLRSVEGGGARKRDDLVSFLDLIDSLPVLELFEGDITWIAHLNIVAGSKNDSVVISTEGANGEWVRVEYLISIKDVQTEIERRKNDGEFENSTIDTPIQINDGRITVYSEVKAHHPSGTGDTVTWTIVVDRFLARVVCHSEKMDGINAGSVFANPKITTLKATNSANNYDGEFHDHVPYEAMLNLEVLDGKFRFQRIATTPCIVYSNTPITDMSKGIMYNDRHDILTTIFQAMDGKDAIMDTPECDFSRYIYMFDNERENIPWHYRFAICNCGAVMITNNDDLICTIKLNEEERRSIIPADLLVDTEPLDTNNATEFSYADESAMFSEGTPGVKYTGFKNATELPIHNEATAIERAKNECTIEWNDTKVYYDTTKDVWKVTCYTKGVPGGDQSVYLGANGITLMIVYGE